MWIIYPHIWYRKVEFFRRSSDNLNQMNDVGEGSKLSYVGW